MLSSGKENRKLVSEKLTQAASKQPQYIYQTWEIVENFSRLDYCSCLLLIFHVLFSLFGAQNFSGIIGMDSLLETYICQLWQQT